jgi:hypothetical protein
MISEFKEFSTKEEIENIERIRIAKDRALLSGSGLVLTQASSFKGRSPSTSFKGISSENRQL